MKPIYLALFVLLIVGCFSLSGPVEASLGEEFTLGIGDSIVLAGTEIDIRFADILEDSRCPEPAICDGQGRVVISLEVAGLAESSTDFNLSLFGYGLESTSLDTLDYRFTLMKVAPYPQEPQEIADEDYEVTLIITALIIVN